MKTNLIEIGVGLVLFLYVMAALVPNALTQVVNGCSTAWGTSTQTLWGILPIFIVIAVVLLVYSFVKNR